MVWSGTLKAQGLTWDEAQEELRGELAYTLHRPVRRKFEALSVFVFHKDEQWQSDLVKTTLKNGMVGITTLDGHRRVVQIRVGCPGEEQDGYGCDSSF